MPARLLPHYTLIMSGRENKRDGDNLVEKGGKQPPSPPPAPRSQATPPPPPTTEE